MLLTPCDAQVMTTLVYTLVITGSLSATFPSPRRDIVSIPSDRGLRGHMVTVIMQENTISFSKAC